MSRLSRAIQQADKASRDINRTLARRKKREEGRQRRLETLRQHMPTATVRSVRGLNDSEAEFKSLCAKNGRKSWRHGWPDFLVESKDGPRRLIGVEVKANQFQELRPTQRRMFAALESIGIQVVVWCQETKKAVSWREWVKETSLQLF